METFLGIMIPFLGTALGAACVFFMKRSLGDLVQRALAGFAAGVMVAASIWSLLIPAIEQSEGMGKLSFRPALVGLGGGCAVPACRRPPDPASSCGKQSGGGTEKQARPHHHDGAGGDTA